MPKQSPPPPLLSIRSAVIMLLGMVNGVLVGILTAIAGATPAAAVLAGLTAGASTVAFFHHAIEAG